MGPHRMCAPLAAALLLLALVRTLIAPAHAYVPIRSTQTGAEVRWRQGAELLFRTNQTNSGGVAPADLFRILTTSLNRWKQASFGGFSFAYYQGTDTSRYPNFIGSRGDNSVFFTSNAGSDQQLNCGIVALTQVWFSPETGIATKADIRFNDTCHRFTTQAPAYGGAVYLGDVATHELGHALGLDHSQNAQSSQVYTVSNQMAVPGCDDRAAMLHLYGGGARAASGTLVGRVMGPTGTPVFGAHVTAISLERGTAEASALTEPDGSFRINGLEPANYALLLEPFYPGAASLNGYYARINPNVCNGAMFARTFALSGKWLRSHRVRASAFTDAGQLLVNCSPPTSAYPQSELAYAGTAPLLTAADITAPVATQGVFSSSGGWAHYYRLVGQSGRLDVRAIAHSLYSPVDVVVEVLDTSGRRLDQRLSENVFTSPISGAVNYDASTVVELAGTQDVLVRVYARSALSAAHFPAGSVGVSSNAYYVLSVSRGLTPEALLQPANARCEGQDDFAPYASLGEAPEIDDGTGGCGMIQPTSQGPGSGPGDGLSQGSFFRLFNFALFLSLITLVRLQRRPKWTGNFMIP